MWNDHPDVKPSVTAVGAFVASILFGCIYWYALALFSFALSTGGNHLVSFAVASVVGGLTGLLVFPFAWSILRRKRVRSSIIWMAVMGALTNVVSMLLLSVVASSNRLAGALIPPWVILGVPVLCGAGSCLLLRPLLPDRTKPGCCQTCRYDLTGNTSGVCPECGTQA